MLFYCPTRYVMGQRASNSGYRTNYTVNSHVMGMPPSNISSWMCGPMVRTELYKFIEFSYSNDILLIFEARGWAWKDPRNFHEWADFVHNNHTNVLLLDGEVKNIRKDQNVPLKFNDENHLQD